MDRRSGDRQTINQEFANLEQFRSEFASDISTTGCFIRSPRPLPVGTQVALKFTVIEGGLAIIEGTGEVVRSVRPPHANPGMGVRFVELTPTSAGALEQMLAKIADFYDEEVDAAVAAMTSLIEPIVIVLMGAVIGGLLVSMYLPMFDMIGAIK